MIGAGIAPEAGLRLQAISDLCTLVGVTDKHTETGLEGLHLALDTDVVDDEAAIGPPGVCVTKEIPGAKVSRMLSIHIRDHQTDLLGTWGTRL